jgi:hypothetical protein
MNIHPIQTGASSSCISVNLGGFDIKSPGPARKSLKKATKLRLVQLLGHVDTNAEKMECQVWIAISKGLMPKMLPQAHYRVRCS